MMDINCYIDPPNRPEAEDVFRLLLRGAIEAHALTGIPIREGETDDSHLLTLWRDGLILVTSARVGSDKGPVVSVMATSGAKTVLGSMLMLILVRYTDVDFRRKGVNDKLSDFTDEMYRKQGVTYAMSVVVPESAGHKQMVKRGTVYTQLQGIRRL